MRKQYNREKQMRRSNGRKERKTWPFYEYMTFLDGIQENLSTPKKLQERLSKPKLSTQTPKFKSTKDDSLDQLFEMLYSTDVEPFGNFFDSFENELIFLVKNIDVVYKKLLSEDMKSKAFEMKKKFTALAEQYESFLYADEDN